MKSYAFLLLLFFSTFSRSETISTMIHGVDRSLTSKEDHMVFLSTGKVLWISYTDEKTFEEYRDAFTKKTTVIVNLKSRKIIGSQNEKKKFLSKNLTDPGQEVYFPSVIKGEEAQELFATTRRTTKIETQCFNRAHVWTYEWRVNQNIYSSKIWLFFTRKFIRKYKFDWWFHVAPLVTVQEGEQVKERVLDMKYAKGPVKLKEWTDIFIRDNSECPVVSLYSDYADYPESGSCFVMKSSMYYYQPIDLEETELSGIPKMKWIRGEVQEAYREAFDYIF